MAINSNLNEPPTRGQPPKRGQKLCSQSVRGSTVHNFLRSYLSLATQSSSWGERSTIICFWDSWSLPTFTWIAAHGHNSEEVGHVCTEILAKFQQFMHAMLQKMRFLRPQGRTQRLLRPQAGLQKVRVAHRWGPYEPEVTQARRYSSLLLA